MNLLHRLIGMGVDLIDLGLSTTPTVEMAVVFEQAQGIILTIVTTLKNGTP